jgi:hypothetical protein
MLATAVSQRLWTRLSCLDERNFANCEEAIADETFSSDVNAATGKTRNGNWRYVDA